MAVTDKATFILNNEYIEQVQKLNDTQAGQLFRTILLYANEQNVDDPADPMVSMVFSFIRQQMDKDYKKYEETCKKRAENGKKGIELALEHNPDVVLMDIGLPEVDGIQATSIIKKSNQI